MLRFGLIISRRDVVSAVLLFLFLIGVPSAVLAQEGPRLDITSVDTSAFPTIQLNLIAAGENSRRIRDLSGLRLSEGTTAIADFEVDDVPIGVEMIFVIDANSTIDDRDQAGGLTRSEKVRDSIVRYADRFMDEAQLDRVSVIVPGQNGGRVLLDRAVFRNEVINEINFYVPEAIGDTPLNEMLGLALEVASQSNDQGRFQAIFLFTDGAQLDEQLDFEALTGRAQTLNVPIFSAILGRSADPDEVANVSRLADPTRGDFVHMPEPDQTDGLYALIQENGLQHQLTYQSTVSAAGSQTITVASGGARDSVDIDLSIAPPLVELPIDTSQTIRRVVSNAGDPLTSAEPTVQRLAAAISFPDGQPRSITELTLVVNGVGQTPLRNPEIGPDGLIDLRWDISSLDSGTYELVVLTEDELGLQGQSEPVQLDIEVERAGAPAGGEGAAESEPAAGQQTGADEEEEPAASDGINIVVVGIALLALFVAVGAVILAVVLVRRRRPGEMAASTPAPAASSDVQHDATQVILPAFAAADAGLAYLEPLENAPDHQGNIPISTSNVAIGRDPKLSQIVFTDKSVSRLHARVMQSGGQYMLYDEGSASGTYINFEQVSLTPQPLKDNDEVHIGRVHLRFHVAEAAEDHDATQIMPGPMRPATAQPAQAAQSDEDGLSTQPYLPHQPASPGQAQQRPQQQPAADDEDEDDISTQPYMPHSPRR